jgi:hypothetical protein
VDACGDGTAAFMSHRRPFGLELKAFVRHVGVAMSVQYGALSWNRQKALYDVTLLSLLALYLGIFVGVGFAGGGKKIGFVECTRRSS